MKTLPPPIRDYLAQGRYSAVAKNLMFKYQLQVDQGGVLEREIMLLLMGIENPDEFTQALAEEAGLEQKTVDGIVQDVNDQIFIPLREEMKSGASKPSVEVKPPQVPTTPPAAPRHIINKIPIPIVAEKLLEDHEEPHIEFAQAPMVPPVSRPAPTPPTPRSITPPAPPRPMMSPPANLPGAARPSGNFGIVGIPPVLPKPYPSDPYREPIDEK